MPLTNENNFITDYKLLKAVSGRITPLLSSINLKKLNLDIEKMIWNFGIY